jgi:hypothetical protein
VSVELLQICQDSPIFSYTKSVLVWVICLYRAESAEEVMYLVFESIYLLFVNDISIMLIKEASEKSSHQVTNSDV